MRVLAGAAVLALGALASAPRPMRAQGRDTVVVPGPEYEAGGLWRTLFGRSYRDLWTVPTRVPFLDLSSFAGGLTPTERGGGNQTASLRFRGADGKEYAFRSLNKRQASANAPGLRGTFVGRVLQDQVSSQAPTGLVAAGGLMEATGALHAPPRIFVMPDDPRLGEFRAEFAGMVGTVEERPDAPFGGAAEIEGTEDFLDALEDDPANQLAAREFLRIRLLDLVMGDWDRHGDQYRWARFDTGGMHLWRPIPRDRDYVFVDYDGLAIDVARIMAPKAVRFDPRIGHVRGLALQGIDLDRRLLGGLDRAAWDSAVAYVQAGLTDVRIAESVGRIPAEHCALRCSYFQSRLKARRDRLPEAAARLYALLAPEAEVHATDVTDRVLVDRAGDAVTVRIFAGADTSGTPYFRRRFVRAETREVRVWMHGGADLAEVRGRGGPLVRILGGGGDDRMEDRGTGGRTVFYDDRGQNAFVRGAETVVDTRSYTPDAEAPAVHARLAEPGGGEPRDWGGSTSLAAPYADFRPYMGLVLGFGPTSERHGFRRTPFATKSYARVMWAPEHTRFGVEAYGARTVTGGARIQSLFLRASELEGTLHYGYGNDTRRSETERAIVRERQVLVEPGFTVPLSRSFALHAFGVARYTDPEVRAGSPAALDGVTGTEPYLALGARGGFTWDRRDDAAYPRRGAMVTLDAAGFPGLGRDTFLGEGDEGAFYRTRGLATAYLSAGRGPVLALRAGGEAAGGAYPLQYAAQLGGSRSLRGYEVARYAGDRSAFGSAEVRTVLARANLGVRGDLGALAFVDAGRVWYDGESEGGLHTATGGGLFFRYQTLAASAVYAAGERGRLYLRLGLPF